MDLLSSTLASGMRSRMEALDLLGNNLANSGTAGFKADREYYSLYVADAVRQANAEGLVPNPTDLPDIKTQWTDVSQGSLTVTGAPLDLALSGKGLFGVQGPNGVVGTRGGSFSVLSSGRVVTKEGHALLLEDGKPLQMDSQLPVEITMDGRVLQQGQTLGRLMLREMPNPADAKKIGRDYYALPQQAGAQQNAVPQVEVQQGKLESSNVAPAEQAVRLVNVMRQFEMMQRAISMSAEMNRRAVEEVARVN